MAYEKTHDRILHGKTNQINDFSWSQFFYSMPGPAIAKTASAPLDRMKIFYQAYSSRWNKHQKGHMKLTTCAKMLHREGGFTGWFRGNGVNVVKSMPEQAIKLNCNRWLRVQFDNYNKKSLSCSELQKIEQQRIRTQTNTVDLPIHQEFFVAGLSGLIAQSTVYPLDTLKVRVALSRTNEYKNILDAFRSIYNEPNSRFHPICNYYRGFFSSLGVILYVATELTMFNSLKNPLRELCRDYGYSPHIGGTAAGFIAPATGTILTYPLQLIRTRYQSDQRPKYGYLTFCRKTWQSTGIRGFFTGITPNLGKSVISGGIILSWWNYVESRRGNY